MPAQKEDLVVFSVKIDRKIKEAFYNFLKARYGENFRGHIRYEVENMIGLWIGLHRLRSVKKEGSFHMAKEVIALVEYLMHLVNRLDRILEKLEKLENCDLCVCNNQKNKENKD